MSETDQIKFLRDKCTRLKNTIDNMSIQLIQQRDEAERLEKEQIEENDKEYSKLESLVYESKLKITEQQTIIGRQEADIAALKSKLEGVLRPKLPGKAMNVTMAGISISHLLKHSNTLPKTNLPMASINTIRAASCHIEMLEENYELANKRAVEQQNEIDRLKLIIARREDDLRSHLNSQKQSFSLEFINHLAEDRKKRIVLLQEQIDQINGEMQQSFSRVEEKDQMIQDLNSELKVLRAFKASEATKKLKKTSNFNKTVVQKEKDEKAQLIESLKKELASQIESEHNKSEAAKKLFDGLSTQLNEKDQIISELKSQVTRLSHEDHACSGSFINDSKLKSLEEEFDATRKSLNDQMKSLHEDISQRDKTISSLHHQLEKNEEALNDAQEFCKKSMKDPVAVASTPPEPNAELIKCQSHLLELDQQNDNLLALLDSKTEALHSTTLALETCESAKNDSFKTISQLQIQQKHLQQNFSHQEKEHGNLKYRLNEATSDLQRCKSDFQEAIRQNTALKSDLAHLSRENQIINASMARSISQRDEHSKELEQSLSKYVSLEDVVRLKNQEKQDLLTNYRIVCTELQKLKAEHVALETRALELESSCRKTAQDSVTFQEKLHTSDSDVTRLTTALRQAQFHIQALTRSCESFSSQQSAFKSNQNRMVEEFNNTRIALSESEKTRDGLMQQCVMLNSEVERLTSELQASNMRQAEISKKAEEQNRVYKQVDNLLSNQRIQYAQLQQELEKNRKLLRDADDSVSVLKQSNAICIQDRDQLILQIQRLNSSVFSGEESSKTELLSELQNNNLALQSQLNQITTRFNEVEAERNKYKSFCFKYEAEMIKNQ